MDDYDDDEVHGNDDDVCFQVKPAKSNTGTVDQLTTGKTQWLHIGIVTTMRMMMTLMMMMMISGTKYEFRVVAENRAGKSQPSETTLPQVVSVNLSS